MANHAKMYAILCAAISDALDLLPLSAENANARVKLENALSRAEELYIEESDEACEV